MFYEKKTTEASFNFVTIPARRATAAAGDAHGLKTPCAAKVKLLVGLSFADEQLA